MTTDITSREDHLIAVGLGMEGDLVIAKGTGRMYKITKVMRVNYGILDEDGRSWKIRFNALKAAPEGAIWGGPDQSNNDIKREERMAEVAKLAQEFAVGDIVEMVKDSDRAKFPGTYLITKKTAPTRFKLTGIGTGIGLTSPASLIRKA